MQTCIGCGKQAPETETNYTLISAQFGWRLSRSKRPDGTIVLEWRCPSCWRDFKRVRTAGAHGSVPPGPNPASPAAPLESFRARLPSTSGDGGGRARAPSPSAPSSSRPAPKKPSSVPPAPRRPARSR